MKQDYYYENYFDQNNNPEGGVSTGRGFTISWQRGPLGRDGDRREPNGAFVEDVIDAVIKRLEFYQDSKFNCQENETALQHLKSAAIVLDERTKDRETRAVEGTHAI